jgi:hypothetical protein
LKLKEKEKPPDEFEDSEGAIMGTLFDLEQGIEKSPPFLRAILRELIDNIVERRKEYYIPVEEEEPEP